MAFADYDFYKNIYIGNLSEDVFIRLSERATDYINSRTNFALCTQAISDEMMLRIKKACCAVTEGYNINENGGGKTSESVDGYSVTYSAGISNTKTFDERLDDALKLYIPDLLEVVSWI